MYDRRQCRPTKVFVTYVLSLLFIASKTINTRAHLFDVLGVVDFLVGEPHFKSTLLLRHISKTILRPRKAALMQRPRLHALILASTTCRYEDWH